MRPFIAALYEADESDDYPHPPEPWKNRNVKVRDALVIDLKTYKLKNETRTYGVCLIDGHLIDIDVYHIRFKHFSEEVP